MGDWKVFKPSGAADPLQLTFPNPPAFAGENYSASLFATGGTEPYAFLRISGTLPTGLSLNATTGEISGFPTVFGQFDFQVRVTDADSSTATAACRIFVKIQDNEGATISVTATEVLPDYQDGGGALHKVVSITGRVSATTFNVRTRIFIDFDDGNGASNMGDYWATAEYTTWVIGKKRQTTGQVIAPPDSIYTPVDPAKINWKVYIECNSSSEFPTGSASEYDFTVTPALPVPVNDVTSATFIPNEIGDVLDYSMDFATQRWIPHEIDISLPDANDSPYLKNLFLTVQAGYIVSCTATVSGGVNVALTSGSVANSDEGLVVFIGGQAFRINVYTDPTHFTIGPAAYGMAPGATDGAGILCEVFRNAPHNTFFGQAGDDDAYAWVQGYWGRKFTDLVGAVAGSPSIVKYTGDTKWDIIPDKYTDDTPNPYLYHYFFVFSISRLADNLAGGGAGTVTFHPNWTTGTPYGAVRATLQDFSLDLSKANRARSWANSSLIGGDGVKHRANLGYTTYLDASGQIAVKNLKSLGSLPTLPSADYEAGSVVRLSTNGKLYRTDGLTWIISTDPQDLATGALFSGVTLNANQVNAGTFNGIKLVLNLSGVTTSIESQSVSTPLIGRAATVGLKTTDNTFSNWAAVDPAAFTLYDPVSNEVMYLNAGGLSFTNLSGERISLRAAGAGQGLYIGGQLVAQGRQTGPGTPSGWADATAQGWAAALISALRVYGCLT